MKNKDLAAKEKRNAELINFILNFAIQNKMSQKEIDECIAEVKKVYYTDSLIIRDFAPEDSEHGVCLDREATKCTI